MKRDVDAKFLCKDCEKYGICKYYHDRKENSYICKYFYLPDKLDKIRAEIEEMTPTYHNLDWSITDLVPINKVLKIIDKHKESEDR